MFIRYEKINARKLVGISAEMSISRDTTPELFSRFMKLISGRFSEFRPTIYDLRVFPPGLPVSFDTLYVKWAAIEQSTCSDLPEQFGEFSLSEGEYAVFLHKGTASDAGGTFGYIFGEWLPSSGRKIDDRPHFDLLQQGYDPSDPTAEHEIWIPVTS